MSIVTSLEGADADVRYTITVLSHMEIVMENRPQRGVHTKTVSFPVHGHYRIAELILGYWISCQQIFWR